MSALTPAERLKKSMANEGEYEKEIHEQYGKDNVEKVPFPPKGTVIKDEHIVGSNGKDFYYRLKKP